jgi:hypothetical protein
VFARDEDRKDLGGHSVLLLEKLQPLGLKEIEGFDAQKLGQVALVLEDFILTAHRELEIAVHIHKSST